MKFKDYYDTLGVSRDASQDDIRKAFRKLARKYHPDVAEDKTAAEEKFKELNEAYEVLGDPEKRQKYDTLGANWKDGADFRPPPGSGFGGGGGFEGYDVHFGGTGFSDFFEAFFGGRRTAGGAGGAGGGFGGFGGGAAGDPFGRGAAGGAYQARGRDIEADILVRLDEVMEGSQRTLTLREPDGSTKTARVRVPKGVHEGQLIRLAGLGNPGMGGGPAGDLFLRVRLERHPDFRVQGADLYYDLEVAPWEAVLGTSVEVRTLHGKLSLRIPAGISGGTELRLRGKGLPQPGGGFGDLYAVVRIQVPSSVDGREKELWEELARTSGFRPRS